MLDASNQAGLRWTKARRSAGTGMCVEVAPHAEGVAVRHSITPAEGAILYTRAEFAAFIDGVKKGEFDHLI